MDASTFYNLDIKQQIATLTAMGYEVVAVARISGPYEMLEPLTRVANPFAALGRPVSAYDEGSTQVLNYKVRLHPRKGGRCKWYTVNGQRVQGTLERRYAEQLTRRGIAWVAHHKPTFVWLDDQDKAHWYKPDFYLPDSDTYIEIKGFWTPENLDKMDRVYAQNPNIRLQVIMEADVKRMENE